MEIATQVPVDPIQKSKRGWMNVAFAIVGTTVAVPEVQYFLSKHPLVAGVVMVISGSMNWILLWKSKKNVVSKIVVKEST